MPNEASTAERNANYFRNKAIFLTGATGNIGGCLLFKLTVILRAQKIYLLCRQSIAQAKSKLKKNMPKQIKDVLAHKNIVFVSGDVTEANFGIPALILKEMEEEVQIVINGAADVSLRASLSRAIPANCLPALELARMATRFQRLEHFVQISTAYCNAFLPDGVVEEKIYPLGDPEKELEMFQQTRTTPFSSMFPGAYYYSKHLMERLLTSRYPDIPLLIVRPSCVGEAVQQPFEAYGPLGSCPLTTFFTFYINDPGNTIWYVQPETGRTSGSNILDIIPVDWVTNLILLHTISGTRGVVHAGAESYQPVTFDGLLEGIMAIVPDEVRKMMPPFTFVQDAKIEECRAATLFKVGTRDWRFNSSASAKFNAVEGPLSIQLHDHSMFNHVAEMVTRVAMLVKKKRKMERRMRFIASLVPEPVKGRIVRFLNI